jgi:hypothetical protein
MAFVDDVPGAAAKLELLLSMGKKRGKPEKCGQTKSLG